MLMNRSWSSWGKSLRSFMCPLSNNLWKAFLVAATSSGFLLSFLHCWSKMHLAVALLEVRKSSYLPLSGRVAKISFFQLS